MHRFAPIVLAMGLSASCRGDAPCLSEPDLHGEVARAEPAETDPPTAETEPEATAEPMRVVELAPGVFAALQPEALRFTDANSLLVATDEGTIIIDAQTDPRSVAWLIEQLEARQLPAPRWLIYTHWHLDHTLGAAQWKEASGGRLEILGHRALTEGDLFSKRLVEQHEELKASLKAAGRDELLAAVDVELLPPTRTVAVRTDIELGGVRVTFHPVAAHSDGDLLVEFPDLGLWATGDVLDAMPFAGHGHPHAWPEALACLDADRVARILPGHGPVYESLDQLEVMRAYWEVLLHAVDETHARAGSLVELQRELIGRESVLEPLRHRLVTDGPSRRAFEAWVPEAAKRAWAELEESSTHESATQQVGAD